MSFLKAEPSDRWQLMFAQLTSDLQVHWRGYYSRESWEEFAAAIPRTLSKHWGYRDGDTFYETSRDVSITDVGYAEALGVWLREERGGWWLEVLDDPEALALAQAFESWMTSLKQRTHAQTANERALAEAAEAKANAAGRDAWIAVHARERI